MGFLDATGITTLVTKLKDYFALKSELNEKQDTLVSGTNIKTIDYKSLVGSGNISLGIPGAYASDPLMDGTASAGSGANYARGNHRHPTDTSRQETLVSGTNIKTVNNTSLLGSGNVAVGTVTGVQINGTSILSSNVANILTNTAYNSSSNKIATMTDITNAMTVVTFTPNQTTNNLIISVQQPSSITNGNEVSY